MSDATDRAYTERLIRLQHVWWKRFFDVQAPYRWNLKRLKPGFTLEIGCGIGRNLVHIGKSGVGIDTNASSVEFAKKQALKAFTPDEFKKSEYCTGNTFDSLLLSHVAEHMTLPELTALLRDHVPYLKKNGIIILITPQEN